MRRNALGASNLSISPFILRSLLALHDPFDRPTSMLGRAGRSKLRTEAGYLSTNQGHKDASIKTASEPKCHMPEFLNHIWPHSVRCEFSDDTTEICVRVYLRMAVPLCMAGPTAYEWGPKARHGWMVALGRFRKLRRSVKKPDVFSASGVSCGPPVAKQTLLMSNL